MTDHTSFLGTAGSPNAIPFVIIPCTLCDLISHHLYFPERSTHGSVRSRRNKHTATGHIPSEIDLLLKLISALPCHLPISSSELCLPPPTHSPTHPNPARWLGWVGCVRWDVFTSERVGRFVESFRATYVGKVSRGGEGRGGSVFSTRGPYAQKEGD